MRRRDQVLASLFVTAALMAPIGAMAMPRPQDDHERHEQEEREHRDRVYDRDHWDYHSWDQREDQAYRHWLDERHEAYVEYNRLNRKRQREYWKWRHEHQEHEEREHDRQ